MLGTFSRFPWLWSLNRASMKLAICSKNKQNALISFSSFVSTTLQTLLTTWQGHGFLYPAIWLVRCWVAKCHNAGKKRVYSRIKPWPSALCWHCTFTIWCYDAAPPDSTRRWLERPIVNWALLLMNCWHVVYTLRWSSDTSPQHNALEQTPPKISTCNTAHKQRDLNNVH